MQKQPGDIDLQSISTDPVRLTRPGNELAEVFMLRLDKIHPQVSGNKWFKLRFYLDKAKALGKNRIITFGGAWSNHILATAAACKREGLPCTGIIRGERPDTISPVLSEAAALGMALYFVSRSAFTERQLPAGLDDPGHLIIPAGGYGLEGAKGAATLLDYCDNTGRFTHICCACGTGTMLAGLTRAAHPGQSVTGISVLKNHTGLAAEVQRLLDDPQKPVSIQHDYHFGGYARHTPALIQFMNHWFRVNRIPTDFVYTGKLCYAVEDLLNKGYFPDGSRILLIHSGGLYGNSSLSKGTLIF